MATIVIQCAARKVADAGRLKTPGGDDVEFVADPGRAPTDGRTYAHPDETFDGHQSWRAWLVHYNQRHPRDNPLRLARAYELYRAPVYRSLVCRFGVQNVFVLSAGWGLIAGDFLTPHYDITFSGSAERYKRRTSGQCFNDLQMCPSCCGPPLVFVGGKHYLKLFADLTQGLRVSRIVYYNSDVPPVVPGCELRRFTCQSPDRRTNWHYELAEALAKGSIDPAAAGE